MMSTLWSEDRSVAAHTAMEDVRKRPPLAAHTEAFCRALDRLEREHLAELPAMRVPAIWDDSFPVPPPQRVRRSVRHDARRPGRPIVLPELPRRTTPLQRALRYVPDILIGLAMAALVWAFIWLWFGRW